MPLFLGLDIGGTKIAGGLVTSSGEVVQTAHCSTPAQDGGAAVLAAALALARSLAAGQTMSGIGVGMGGQVNADLGVIVSATELLPGWAGTPVKTAFENALGVPTFVDNDVNALAIGEARFGAARDLLTVVFLALGTGVGGALLLNGKVHHGAHWSGGEFGHLLLNIGRDARLDAGGHRGTLEAYASGTGLETTYRELTGTTRTGREIAADAQHDPDGLAAQAITRTGEHLGYGLVSLANALDPDLIVIGGGLTALGEPLIGPARAILRQRALPGPAQCPVVTASLGINAAIIGAASLAMPT